MVPQRDIHNYDRKYKQVKQQIDECQISEKNKKVIFEFEKCCLLDGLSKPRRIKLMGTLRLISLRLKKDFDLVTKEELRDMVIDIENIDKYSPWTKQSYKAILKKFYRWLVYGDKHRPMQEYPEIVSWINTNIKPKDLPKVQASDILTEEEICRLIKAAEHPRDRAFISMLYELGARIGEIGNLEIKDVTPDKYGFLIDLNGKTGRRTPRILMSAPYLVNWLNDHPEKDKPDASLWTLLGDRKKDMQIQYQSLRVMVNRIVKRAGINKRIYPHLFRHTRVTHLLANKQINEAQAKTYFGWTPSSDQLSQYSHLMSNDVNETLLKVAGIKNDNEKESKLMPKQCSMCKTINSPEALFCQKCAKVMDVRTAIQLDEQRRESDEAIQEFVRELIENNSTLVINALRRKPELMDKIKNLAA